MEDGEIGIHLDPSNYTKDIASEFISRIESREWDAAALVTDIPAEYRGLHPEKVDVSLREALVLRGLGTNRREWLNVPTEFEKLYMLYLANHIADKNRLSLLTDSPSAWTGSTYFHFSGMIEDFPTEDYTQQQSTMVVRDIIPSNIIEIEPYEILKFRRKYRDERTRLLQALRTSAKTLSECDDPLIVKDHMEDIRRDIESALKDYQDSLSTLNIISLTGLKSITFPVYTGVASTLFGQALDPSKLLIASISGIALGLISGIKEWKKKNAALSKQSNYSYLYHLGREWKNITREGNDYNYYLCRQMEEFIND